MNVTVFVCSVRVMMMMTLEMKMVMQMVVMVLMIESGVMFQAYWLQLNVILLSTQRLNV
jgi:hypothetical protein